MNLKLFTILCSLCIFASFFSPGCSDKPKPVCGDGKVEGGEECDCGEDPNDIPESCRSINGAPRSTCSTSCTLQTVQYTTLNIMWTLNGSAPNGGSFDTCPDMDVDQVHVHTVGPNGFVRDDRIGCSTFQVSYYESNTDPLHAGNYTVTATPLSAGVPVAEPQTGGGLVQLDLTTNVVIDFPLEAFYGHESMEGDLLVSFDWAGQPCGDASPIVETTTLTLSLEGEVLAGYPVSKECSGSYWVERDLPAKELTMRVEGVDSADASAFCLERLIKVGVGNNQAYDVTVPPVSDGSCP